MQRGSRKWVSGWVLSALVILTLAVRLYRVDTPIAHWRQADTAAMAKNYYAGGYAFAYPQIDWAGEPGYIESEFPAFPFAVALMYRTLGEAERYGRILSAAMWALSVVFLYSLVRRLVDERTALWAAFYHSILPLNLLFGRAFMPEATLIASLAGSVLFFSRWLVTEKALDFFFACLFTSTAILVKLPSLYIGLPLLYLAWLKFGRRTLLEPSMWVFAALVLVPPILWYSHAHAVFERFGATYGIWDYGSGKWGNWSLVFSSEYWIQVLFKSVAHKHLAWFGFPLVIIGLFLRRRTAVERAFDFWLLALLVYLLVVGTGNFVHEYYQLPLMLPAVVFAGKVHARYMTSPPFRSARSIALVVCAVGTMIMSLARHGSELKDEAGIAARLGEIATILASETEESDLVLLVQENHDPSLIYTCRRKGWIAMPSELNEGFLSDKVRRGLKYILGAREQTQLLLRIQSRGFSVEPVADHGDQILLRVVS